MVLGGLDGAHGKRWGLREAEDEGWSGGRAGGAVACRAPAWEGEGLPLEADLDTEPWEKGRWKAVPMTAFGFRLRSCRCFWTMTHNKENILLYKRTNTYPASLKTSLTKYAPERMIFSFLICSTPLHSNPCSFIQKVLDSLSWSYHEHSTSHSLCGVFFSNVFWKS